MPWNVCRTCWRSRAQLTFADLLLCRPNMAHSVQLQQLVMHSCIVYSSTYFSEAANMIIIQAALAYLSMSTLWTSSAMLGCRRPPAGSAGSRGNHRSGTTRPRWPRPGRGSAPPEAAPRSPSRRRGEGGIVFSDYTPCPALWGGRKEEGGSGTAKLEAHDPAWRPDPARGASVGRLGRARG
jgi:hypothetical protein